MMKKKYTYIIAFLLGAASLISCSGSDDVTNASKTDGLVPVTLQMAGSFQNVSSRTLDSDLAGDSIFTVPKDSTLWLFYTAANGVSNVQGYRVMVDEGGVKSLYPCPIIKDDVKKIWTINKDNPGKTPLYLESGETYTFRAISPALPIYNTDQISNTSVKHFNFTNGMYAVATNDKHNLTKATTVTINVADNEKVVMLNPMLEIGSRLKFDIVAGKNISQLSVIQQGLEIDGLGAGVTTLNYNIGDELYNTGSGIVLPIGNPYNQIYISKDKFKYVTYWSDDASGNTKGVSASVGILPIDCRSTQVFVILNLMVNGTPQQFTFAINNRYFQAAYSYNYKITLSVTGGITVANWQENSWTTDAEAQK